MVSEKSPARAVLRFSLILFVTAGVFLAPNFSFHTADAQTNPDPVIGYFGINAGGLLPCIIWDNNPSVAKEFPIYKTYGQWQRMPGQDSCINYIRLITNDSIQLYCDNYAGVTFTGPGTFVPTFNDITKCQLLNSAGTPTEVQYPPVFYLIDARLIDPQITSITPAHARPGKQVTIAGSNFRAYTGVSTLESRPSGGSVWTALYTLPSDTATTTAYALTASYPFVVPSSLTPGSYGLHFKNSYGVSNEAAFTVDGPPRISSISPASTTTGSIVTLTVTGFDPTGNSVQFSSVSNPNVTVTLSNVSMSGGKMTATVPLNLTPGPYTVGGTAADGTVSNTVNFYVSKPTTLVLYIAGAGADPYYLNQLYDTLNADLNTGSNASKFDLEVFPDTAAGMPVYSSFANHRKVVPRLLSFLSALGPDSYNNVVIVTHSAGYMMLKTAVLAAAGVSYGGDPSYFASASDQQKFQAFFKKAYVVSLSPPMGGSTIAKTEPPLFLSQDYNPASKFQAWLAGVDWNFKNSVGYFESHMVVDDPLYHGLWTTRKNGGTSRDSLLTTLKYAAMNVGAVTMFNWRSDTLESGYYDVEKSANNQEYPASITPTTPAGVSIHHALLYYSPLITAVEAKIISIQSNNP